jgi:hypothetical protein
MRFRLIGIVAVCLLPGVALGVGQEFIPLENWAYDAIDRFESLGLCNVPDDAPFTRPEFIKIVNEIKEKAFDRRLSARDRYELDRLEKEFTEFASQRDPQARYDPPTFFLEERPVVFELDFDLAGIAAKRPLSEFGTEFFLNSNPEIRFHFSDHATYDVRYRFVMGPEHGDRARGEKAWRRVRSFKGLTSLYERSYIILGWDRIHVYYGRDYTDWGPSQWGNLITPGFGVSLDKLGWRAQLKWFRLSMFNSQLSPVSRRRMAGHRLEMRFARVTIGLNETVVYARKDWDPIYFFPLASFYANQYAERDNDDNIYWSADLKVSFLNALTLYGSFLVDDFQFERDGENPDKYAFDIGGRLALSTPVATTWRAQYRWVDIYTYSHFDSLGVYVSGEGELENGDRMLGGQPGADSESWRVEGAFYPHETVIATGAVFSNRLGEGNDLRAHEDGAPVDPPHPSGVVQRTRGVSLKLRWELKSNSWVEGYYAWARIANVGHVKDDNEDTNAFRLVIRWDF